MEQGLTAHQVVNNLRGDFIEIEGVDKLINKVLYRLMIQDYRSSGVERYGVSFSQWQYGAMNETGGFADLVRKQVGKTLGIVRANMRKKAASVVVTDPGQARKGVKMVKYKNTLGGTVSILSKKRASNNRRSYPEKKDVDKNGQHRLGNRWPVSEDTKRRYGYTGEDRSFILRFFNGEQAKERTTRYGNRGSMRKAIRPNWFSSAKQEMQTAVDNVLIPSLEKAITSIANSAS